MRLKNVLLFSAALLVTLAVFNFRADSNAYAQSVIINGDTYSQEAFTKDRNTTLTLDYSSIYTQMRISNSVDFAAGTDTISWTTASRKRYNWYLSTGEGVKTVYVQFKTDDGSTSSVYSDTIILDTAGPSGSININNGLPVTNSTAVSLSITALDTASQVAQMMVSTDPNFSGASWEAFSNVKSIVLSGDGTKTVYVKFKDAAGNESAIYSDSIILQALPTNDTFAPSGSIYINNNASITNSVNVTLNITGYDSGTGINSMQISNDASFAGAEWVPYTVAKSWTLAYGDGVKTVYIKLCDGAGNISQIYSDTITLQGQAYDTTPPTGSVNINNGAATTDNAYVSLAVYGSDSGGSGLSQVRISNSPSFGTSAQEGWQAFNGSMTASWYLGLENGIRTVYVQFKDTAGNMSAVYSDSITVQTKIADTKAPIGNISINNDASLTNSRNVILNISAVDAGVGEVRMIVSNKSNFAGAKWEPYSPIKNWVLESGNGIKTVYINFVDGNSNQSIVYSDSITLKTEGPDKVAPTAKLSINNGDTFTANTEVTLNILALNGNKNMYKMKISNNSKFSGAKWEPYDTVKKWKLTSGRGVKTVYINFIDSNSKQSYVYSDTITLSTTGNESSKSATKQTKASISSVLVDEQIVYGQSYKASVLVENPNLSQMTLRYQVTYYKNGAYILGDSGVIQTASKGRVYAALSPITDRSVTQIKVEMYLESISGALIDQSKQSAESKFINVTEGKITLSGMTPTPYTTQYATIGAPIIFSANFMVEGTGTWTGKYERYVGGVLSGAGNFTISNNTPSWSDIYTPTSLGKVYYKFVIGGKTIYTGVVNVR